MSGGLRRWQVIGLTALAVIVVLIPVYGLRRDRTPTTTTTAVAPTFVGREECRPCHEPEFQSWLNSDHDKAMDVANEDTVLGDFNDARFTSRNITARFYRKDGKYFVHTAGPGGRMQCLTIAWDTELERWFDLYQDTEIPPDDWLSWTGAGQNWNGMCAECHSTNLKKAYDPAIKDFGLTRPTADLVATDLVDLCAPCHSRRTILGDYDHTKLPLLENLVPTTLDEGL